jgi:predicted homoserine dehydrogenase-like protein
MNYLHLFQDLATRRIRMALTGAKGGFGRSLLVQCRMIPAIEITALCDLDLDGVATLLNSLGIPPGVVCETAADVRAAQSAGQIALIRDHTLLEACALDIVVEATGVPEASIRIAAAALGRSVHVAMATKETDSVAGPYLNRLARQHNVVYTTPDGDQPSNLIGLVTWARVLGFDVVCAGKSSEYDYVFTPETGKLSYTDRSLEVPALGNLWHLGANAAEILAARRQTLAALPQSATPDYCEMNVVANSTGLLPACDDLSYPLCRISELADVFIPQEDGGILGRTGVVDVFNCLRRDDEASFGGGVFIVVRCTDAEIWELLRQKGHLVSRNGRYACIYLPYHLMGLETPISLFSAVLQNRPSGAADMAVHAVMVAKTERAFKIGETLVMGGHHHAIDGARPQLLALADAPPHVAPFYVAANKRLRVDVSAGDVVTLDMLDLHGTISAAAWEHSLNAGIA